MRHLLTEEIGKIKKMMGIPPKPINVHYHEHLIETYSDVYEELSEDNELDKRYIVIDNEWISKINFQKEAEIKKTNVIFQENIYQPISISIYKKEQTELMSDI